MIPRAFELTTSDGQRISTRHYHKGHARAVILAHGFFNNKDVVLFRDMAERLIDHYDVLVFDFRGHGKSSGLFSWTTYEDKDLESVIAFARTQSYHALGLVGFSLGAAVSLVVAARQTEIRSVVAVSCPCDFWQIDYHFWEPDMARDLKLNLGVKGVGKGVRPGNPFMEKVRPVEVISKISPRPVLLIHGQEDWLIKPRHSQVLFEAAKDPKKMEIIPGAGHAERIYDTHQKVFLDLCTRFFEETLTIPQEA